MKKASFEVFQPLEQERAALSADRDGLIVGIANADRIGAYVDAGDHIL